MGGIGKAVGSLLGGGGKNKFQATAANDAFRANAANLDESEYGDAIRNAVGGVASGAGDQAALAQNAFASRLARGNGPAAGAEMGLARRLAGSGGATADAQSELAAALQARASGQTPSLAQRQLTDATQANAAQAAGQIASIKGLNPALAARMIAQNAAAANQTAAGQAATTRLQEQMGAEQELASALQAQRGQELSQAGLLGQTLSNVQGQDLTRQGLLNESLQNTRAQDIAQQQADASLVGTLGGLQQGQNAQRIQNQLGTQQINANISEGNAGRQMQAQDMNAKVAEQNAKTGGNLLGGVLGAAGTIFGGPVGGAIGSAIGGALSKKYDGGEIEPVDARGGGKVSGRAKVSGDSPENDTVHAVVSPGEIVLPRTVAQAEDAPAQAAEFVKAIRAKKKEPVGYGKVLEAHRVLTRFLANGGEVGASLGAQAGDLLPDIPDDEEGRKRVLERALDTTTGLARRAKDAAKSRSRRQEEALELAGEG